MRWDYPFDDKNDIYFGVHRMTAMASRYQDPNQRKHVMYYYVHGGHVFDNNWRVHGGVIHSNARSIEQPFDDSNKTSASKVPGFWLGVWYKNTDLQKPGTYDIWATYRREPGLTWPTVTDWWPDNHKGYRIGFDYVLAKNLTFTSWMHWTRDIDTHERHRRYRFQMDAYF